MTLKYSVGTILKCLVNDSGFIKGKEYVVVQSRKYRASYGFLDRPDHGYIQSYVENPKYFELAKITNWRGRVE